MGSDRGACRRGLDRLSSYLRCERWMTSNGTLLRHPMSGFHFLPVTEKETLSILAQALNCQGANPVRGKSGAWKVAATRCSRTESGLALLESRVLAIDNGRLRFGSQSNTAEAAILSDTVQRVIVSRVDRLPAAVQQTLKAASVVGESSISASSRHSSREKTSPVISTG